MSDTDPKKDIYKDTVFLPKTDFPMRGALPEKEPEILTLWRESGLYEALRAKVSCFTTARLTRTAISISATR